MISLLRTHCLTIKRYTGESILNLDGTFSDQRKISFPIQCSVQPYQKGIMQRILPEGYSSEDARIVFTEEKINTSSQFTGIKPDTTEIDGQTFFAESSQPWQGFGLQADHYTVLFLREEME